MYEFLFFSALSSVAFVFTVLLIGDGKFKYTTESMVGPPALKTHITVSLWRTCWCVDSVDMLMNTDNNERKMVELFDSDAIFGCRTVGIISILMLYIGSLFVLFHYVSKKKVLWIPATGFIGFSAFFQMVYMSLATSTIYNKLADLVKVQEKFIGYINVTGWAFTIGWIAFVLLMGTTALMIIYGLICWRMEELGKRLTEKLPLFVFLLMFICLPLTVLSVTGDHIQYALDVRAASHTQAYNIWTSCISCVPFTKHGSTGFDIEGVNYTAVRAVQVLCILSAVTIFVAVTIYIIHLLTKQLSLIASGILFSFSAIFIMAALATWMQLVNPVRKKDTMHHSWALGIGWTNFLLLLLLVGIVIRSSKIKYQRMH